MDPRDTPSNILREAVLEHTRQREQSRERERCRCREIQDQIHTSNNPLTDELSTTGNQFEEDQIIREANMLDANESSEYNHRQGNGLDAENSHDSDTLQSSTFTNAPTTFYKRYGEESDSSLSSGFIHGVLDFRYILRDIPSDAENTITLSNHSTDVVLESPIPTHLQSGANGGAKQEFMSEDRTESIDPRTIDSKCINAATGANKKLLESTKEEGVDLDILSRDKVGNFALSYSTSQIMPSQLSGPKYIVVNEGMNPNLISRDKVGNMTFSKISNSVLKNTKRIPVREFIQQKVEDKSSSIDVSNLPIPVKHPCWDDSTEYKDGERENEQVDTSYISRNKFGPFKFSQLSKTVMNDTSILPSKGLTQETSRQQNMRNVEVGNDREVYWDYISQYKVGDILVPIKPIASQG